MSAVITKRQKNSILILGAIAGVFGAVAGASGLLLREKYLTFDQDWDVDVISGFTEGYFGVMSGFMLFLLGTLGYGLVFSRVSYMVFFYWFFSLSCDTLCILDTMMIMPYTQDNGKFAWEEPPENCTLQLIYPGNSNISHSNTDFRMSHLEYCNDIKDIGILLIIITTATLAALLFSCVTTLTTSVALCRARSIANAEQASIPMGPFTTPEHFQPMSFNNTVYQTDGFRK